MMHSIVPHSRSVSAVDTIATAPRPFACQDSLQVPPRKLRMRDWLGDSDLRRPELPPRARRAWWLPRMVSACLILAGALPATATQDADPASRRPLNFENDIVPILSKLGCNAGGCHGKAEGQNGFKLSVFGFDPASDYDAIVKEARGRRVTPAAPKYSLILHKPLGLVPHGGGKRIVDGSREHQTLLRWITAGLPYGSPSDPTVQRIEIEPKQARLEFGAARPLRVTAILSDGSLEDVTLMANYS